MFRFNATRPLVVRLGYDTIGHDMQELNMHLTADEYGSLVYVSQPKPETEFEQCCNNHNYNSTELQLTQTKVQTETKKYANENDQIWN